MRNIDKRLDNLAAALVPDRQLPPYVAITQDQAARGELPANLPGGWVGKLYVGISPDDWDEPEVNHG